jgi:adenylate cyclase
LGDGVNLAARLEGQSKPYGVKLVLGPQTAELVGDVYQVVELDLIAVKGKTEPARIYTAFPFYDTAGELQHKKFLGFYRSGNWEDAKMFASDLKKCWQGELVNYYDMMLERMEGEPPANFDGVYRATSK